jgi:hypothetical protein
MLTYSEFVLAVQKGVQRGNSLCVNWSQDRTVQDQGGEYLLTVEIARSLFTAQKKKDGGGSVFLEVRPTEILKYGPVKRGRPEKALRHMGRVDIVLCDKRVRPIAVVEVKRFIGGIAGDLKRLGAILNKCNRRVGGTVRYGCVAAITVVERDNLPAEYTRLQTRVTRLQKHIDSYELHLEQPSRIRHDLQKEGRWYSYALCVTLKKKKL